MRLARFLLVGAITAVSVALCGWTVTQLRHSSSRVPAPQPEKLVTPSVEFRVSDWRRVVTSVFAVSALRRPGMAPADANAESAALEAYHRDHPPPEWVPWDSMVIAGYRRSPPGQDPAHAVQTRAFYASGWPVRCLRGSLCILDMNSVPRPHGLVYVSLLKGAAWMPVFPYWPGLITDTMIFATFWWFAWRALVAVRVTIRRCRGLCPRCAYNLRGQPTPGCPECGWSRTTANSPAA